MLITDYYDFIVGTKSTGNVITKEIYRYQEDDDIEASMIFQVKSKTAMSNLIRTNNANSFYKAEPDVAIAIGKEKRDEYFYIMKTGLYSEVVPAKFIYMLQECYKQHGTYNMLFKFIPPANAKEVLSENYLGLEDLKLVDVIKSFDKNFVPISKSNLIVKNGEYYDVYIPAKDRIAIVPKEVAEEINPEKLKEYKVAKGEIVDENGRPISSYGNYIGVHSDTYDMRDLI